MIIQREKHTYYLPTDVITFFATPEDDNSQKYEEIEFGLIEDDILVTPYESLVSFKNINLPYESFTRYVISEYDTSSFPDTGSSYHPQEFNWPYRNWNGYIQTDVYFDEYLDSEGSFDIYYDEEFVTTIRVITYATPPEISQSEEGSNWYPDSNEISYAGGTITYTYTSDKPVFWGNPKITCSPRPYRDSDGYILGYYNTGFYINSNLNYNTYCYGTEFVIEISFEANPYNIYRYGSAGAISNINPTAKNVHAFQISLPNEGVTPESIPNPYKIEVDDEVWIYSNDNLTKSINAYVIGYEGEVTDGDGWNISVPPDESGAPDAFYNITFTNPTNYNTDINITCYGNTDTSRYGKSFLTFNGYPVRTIAVWQASYSSIYEYYVSTDNITFESNDNLTQSINAYVIGFYGDVGDGDGWDVSVPSDAFYDITLTNPLKFNTDINITCYENTNPTSRTSSIVLTFNDNFVKTITINQDAYSGGTSSGDTGTTYEYYVSNDNITFASNYNLSNLINAYVIGYEGEVTDGDGWNVVLLPDEEVFYDVTFTNPTNYNTDIMISCDENTNPTSRRSRIQLTFNGNPVKIITINQDTYYVSTDNITFESNENLTKSINAYVVGYEGEVTNGNGWEIRLPQEVFYVITLTNPTNYNTDIIITCYENTDTDSRSGTFYLTFNDNTVKLFTINQRAYSGDIPPEEPDAPPIDEGYTTNNDLIIDIYPTIQYVGYNGGYVRFNITTNYLVYWEMGYSADWLNNSLRVNEKESIFEFNVFANTSSERSARITFTTSFSGATYTKEVVIWQEATETVPEFNDNYWSVPPMFMDGVDTISYTNSEGTSTDMENNPITINRGINNHSLYNTVYYDNDVRLCFKKGDDKVVDGEDVLIFYDKPKYFKDDFNERYAVYLTDDNPEMMILNDGKPCWLYNQSNMNDAYSTILQYPHFGRYLTYNNNVTDSYNIGNPIKTFTLDYKFSEGTDIYSRRWDDFLSEQYNINTRILECYVKLPYNVMQEYLRNFFYFDDSYWCLIEVIDYSLTSERTTKCKFIKVTDIGNYI